MGERQDVQVLPPERWLQEGFGRAEPRAVLGGRLHVGEAVARLCNGRSWFRRQTKTHCGQEPIS